MNLFDSRIGIFCFFIVCWSFFGIFMLFFESFFYFIGILHFLFCCFNDSKATSIRWDLFLYLVLSLSSLSIHLISSSSIVALMGLFICRSCGKFIFPHPFRLYYNIYLLYLQLFYIFYNMLYLNVAVSKKEYTTPVS